MVMEDELVLNYNNSSQHGSENDLPESPRTSGIGALAIVGAACCAGPLVVAGVISLPTLGILGGIGLLITTLFRSFRSFVKI